MTSILQKKSSVDLLGKLLQSAVAVEGRLNRKSVTSIFQSDEPP
jgi:hypothetical protein